ncbi:hypothetical protein QBC39DRAFT_130000 [Podospora conica]|nr:hypothetical protein QBC39DRAFT_130000 [Schizothecium conicum]
MSALALLISLASLPATHSSQVDLPCAATFSPSLHRFPSTVANIATKTPLPATESGILLRGHTWFRQSKANSYPRTSNKATTCPRAIPGTTHRQLD